MKKTQYCSVLAIFVLASTLVTKTYSEQRTVDLLLPSLSANTAEKILIDTVSTEAIEFNSSFTKQYNELFFTRASNDFSNSNIWVAYSHDGENKAQKITISGLDDEKNTSDVHISPDGNQLFFVIEASQSTKKSQLYTASREGLGWGKLEKVNLSHEQENRDLYYPNTTGDGHLYFAQRNEGSSGDIYRAKKTKLGYAAPVKLPSTINTEKLESDAFISPDESYLIFSRMHDEKGKGMSDLYISFNLSEKNSDQINWSPAINMDSYNTAYVEGSAFVTSDGKTLLFTSNRDAVSPSSFNGKLDIYAVRFDINRWQALNIGKR